MASLSNCNRNDERVLLRFASDLSAGRTASDCPHLFATDKLELSEGRDKTRH